MVKSSAGTFAERFLHVDMDAFYVEVERRGDPSLLGVPVVVGGLGPRGVVSSASYEARAHGVRSAMPITEARRRLPGARYVTPDHRRYGEMSDQVFDVLGRFTPAVEGLSVDEAFLDVAGLRLHYDTPADVGEAIRHRLRIELDLPASVGVATTKFLAKLASEDAKPDGMLVIPSGGELGYLHPLPVRRLWGVGAATHAGLEALAVRTIGDLVQLDPRVLASRLGPANGAHLSALARGKDPRGVEVSRDAKSISAEETYSTDLADQEAIETALLDLCSRLAYRLRRADQTGRTITLKLRHGDFTTVTRSLTRDTPVRHATELWDIATALLARAMIEPRGVRLLGLGVTHLEPAETPQQLSITDDRRSRAGDAAEEIRAKFGSKAVLRARLSRKPSNEK